MNTKISGIDRGENMSFVAFLFPGQGSQTVGMGEDLFDHSSAARKIFERADRTLGFEISKLCFEGPEEKLKLTQYTQPALLTVSCILFQILGIKPNIAAGHSLGEYSALVASGGMSFEDALILVHKRGKYMQEAVQVGEGSMAAVLGADHQRVKQAVKEVKNGVAEIANWNSKDQIVISGHKKAVDEALTLIDPPRSVALPVSAPFHTSLMKSAEEKLSRDLDLVEFNDLEFPIITNVEARVIHEGSQAKEALKKQVSHPVLWYQTIEVLREKKTDICVELGPKKVLTRLIKRSSRGWKSTPQILSVEDIPSLEKAQQVLS